MHKQEICCRGCGRGLTAFEHQAASTCAKCGRGPYCSRCDGNHAENCQKPLTEESWNCAGCGQNFADLADFTMHAETCVRPTAKCDLCGVALPKGMPFEGDGFRYYCLPCNEQREATISPPKNEDDGARCPICKTKHGHGDMRFSDGVYQYCVKCWSAKYPEGDPPKVSGNYYDAKATREDPVEALFRPAGSNSGHHFDWALRQMLSGNRVYREDWNGRELPARVGSEGVWIAISTPHPKIDSMTLPFIYIRSITGSLVPWVPTQSALLMHDWLRVED